MADYNLTNSWANVDTQVNNAETQLTPTLGNVVYHANGNGVTAAEAATAIKGAKDGNIGIKAPTISTPNDIDDTKFFSTAASWTGSPLSGSNANNQGSCLHIENTNTAYATQLFTQAVGSDVYRIRRKLADVWQPWQELYHTGNTGTASFSTNPTLDGSIDIVNIGRVGEGIIDIANNTTGAATAMGFHNPNGVVGSISTSGTSTAYNTSSDNRLKTVVGKPTDADIDAKFNDIYETFTLFNWKNNPDGDAVWGFLAHDVIDKGLDFGSEGEGPRNLNIGDVYETIPEETEQRPVMETITDEDGSEIEQQATDENGNLLFETVVIKEAVEKRVTPAGVDQSKVVPYLVAKIEKQDRLIANLIERLDAAGL